MAAPQSTMHKEEDDRPAHRRRRVALWVLVTLLCGGYLTALALNLSHNLDEVHGYNQYANPSILFSDLLTRFPEPGHHVLHKLILRLFSPFVPEHPLQLRWLPLLCALIFVGILPLTLQSKSFTGRSPSLRTSHLPWLALPLCFSYFSFYASQSRGYMMGLLAFSGFFICAQKLHESRFRGFSPAAAAGMAFMGFAATFTVLSNAMFVVGACIGFGFVDLLYRRFKILALRVGAMTLSGGVLLLVHPVSRNLDDLERFSNMYGLEYINYLTTRNLLLERAYLFLEPFPWLWLTILSIGLVAMIVRRNPLVIVVLSVGCTCAAYITWTQNLLFHRTFYTIYLLIFLIAFEGLTAIVSLVGYLLGPTRSRYVPPLTAIVSLVFFSASVWPQQNHTLDRYSEWVNSINLNQWTATEDESTLTLLPWYLFQPYFWENRDPYLRKLNTIYSRKQLKRIQLVHLNPFEPHSLVQEDSGEWVPFPYDLTPHSTQIESTRVNRVVLDAGRFLGEWRRDSDPVPVPPVSNPILIVLVFQDSPWADLSLAPLTVSKNLTFAHRQSTGPDSQSIHVHLVLDPIHLDDIRDQLFDQSKTEAVLLFGFKI